MKRACKGRELDPTTPEQRALFGELDPVSACFLQLVGKRYPLKAVRILVIKEKWKKKHIPFRQNLRACGPFRNRFNFWCQVQLYPTGSPRKGGVLTRGETLAKELNLERSDFVFGRHPSAFRSGRAHQWLSGDLTGENFSAHNHQRKTTDIVVFISDMG